MPEPTTAPAGVLAAIERRFAATAGVLNRFGAADFARIARAAEVIGECLEQGGKVLTAGNGGSAAEAQHLAGELVGRYLRDRRALAAIALTADSAILTAVANDFSFASVFARQVEALGTPGDVFVGLTTSGRSANIVRAAEAARERGLTVITLLGAESADLAGFTDLAIHVPATETPLIQEAHLVIVHLLCALVEERIAG